MAEYDFADCLSPIDFELLSKDLLEAELGIQLENFSEGRDQGIDLRYAPVRGAGLEIFDSAWSRNGQRQPELIVQCKRYSSFANLKSELRRNEIYKIEKINPARYILTTSVSLSPQQANEIKAVLSPFVQSTGDIYGRERLNSIVTKHPEIERRHVKLWIMSAGILDAMINAETHVISREEVERTIAAAKLYVRNDSFDEALAILKEHRVCIISGLPGIGKTTLARMLLLYFYDRKFDVVKIGSDISEARAVGYHKNPRFFYYDDFLGQTAQADKMNKNEDQRLLDFMASVRESKDSLFVLTTREYILNQARLNYEKLAREKFDHRTCIIDLSKYSRRIRGQILYNHLYFSKLPRAHLEAFVSRQGYLQVIDHKNYNPRLIEYLTDLAWIGEVSSCEYVDLFIKKLDNPVDIWEHAFRNQLSDRARHLLFILTTLPTESRLGDVEQAFMSFHNSQCARFCIAHSATDFKSALRELDGTFAATRNVQSHVLVRFQNPSIRDFMQHLLLGGEQLEGVISTLVFFEQSMWLVETLEEEPQVSCEALVRHIPQIVDALQRLLYANSCSISVVGTQQAAKVLEMPPNPAARLATIVSFTATMKGRGYEGWIDQALARLAGSLKAGSLSAASIVGSVEVLKEQGHLDSAAGRELILGLKEQAVSDPCGLDDFQTLAQVIETLPELFDEAELKIIRADYSDFADCHASECDFTNPDELRYEASRIGEIGDLLQVDTDSAQETLREAADEIEKTEVSSWDDEDRGCGGKSSDECSDGELDSMFGTLGN